MINIDKVMNQLMNNNGFNPFSETYSPSKIEAFLRSLKNEGEDININNIGTVESTIYLHHFYRLLVEESQQVINETRISYDESERFFVASANRNNVLSHYKLKKHIEKIHLSGGELNFEDIAGSKILASDIESELFTINSQIIETINQAQRIISQCVNNVTGSDKVEKLFGHYFRLFEIGNYVFILKDVYNGAVWEGGYIECDHETLTITLKYHNSLMPYVKRIGELRQQRVISGQLSHMSASIRHKLYSVYWRTKKGRYISVSEVTNGDINIHVEKLSENIYSPFSHYLSYVASIETFYPFLQDNNTNLYNFDGLTLNDVHILLSEISYILYKAVSIVALEHARADEDAIENDLEKYVFRIQEEVLYSSLLNVTTYSLKQIESFLSNFTLLDKSAIDYWRTPIIKKEGYFVFLVEPLTAQNKIYLTDYILQRGNIQMSQRGAELENFVKEDISYELDIKGYFHKILQQKKFSVSKKLSEEIDLVLITKHTILIAEIKCISSVVDSRSLYNAQKQLKKGVDQVRRKSKFILDNINTFKEVIGDVSLKDIFCVVITNLPNFTGLIHDDVPIIDIVALNNYFGMGSLEVRSQGRTITYYTNEEEFSKNIREHLSKPSVVWSLKDHFQYFTKKITPEDFNLKIHAEVVQATGELIE